MRLATIPVWLSTGGDCRTFYTADQPVFLTWCLHDSLPITRFFLNLFNNIPTQPQTAMLFPES
jgi:hypothetical protein